LSLLRFGYLRRKRMLTLLVILTLASTLFSLTAYSFLGFYNGFTNYVGEDPSVIAVYSKIGSTPYSGVIPIELSGTMMGFNGVVAVSPETIAPCTINNQSVFIRGIIPNELSALNPLNMVDGQALNITDVNSAIIGQSLSQRLNLRAGDKILAFSVLSEKCVELQVTGIFQSQSSLNDEALVPMYVGQWLRGISYNEATLLRIKINPSQTNANQIYQQMANQITSPTSPASPSPPPESQAQKEFEALIPLTPATLSMANIGITQSQQFMQSYLERYGISRDALFILSVAVLVFTSGAASVAITLFVRQHSSDIDILRSIGVSARKVKADLAMRMIVWALIATFLGTLISALVIIVFQQLGFLLVLSHTITFQLDPLIVAANFLLLSLIVSLNLTHMELKR
jgi:ABC-type lipoprotein release transport system permease subunit